MIITSKENSIIKQTKKLAQNSKTRKKEGAFVAEGLSFRGHQCEGGAEEIGAWAKTQV